MVNNKEFTIRLQKILTYYGLSAAAFAEKMGIGRSTISHIISGRNKPSLEFVLHILETFEDVTFDWLIYGKGTFPKTTTPTPILETTKNSNPKTGQQNIFSDKNVNTEKINSLPNTPVNLNVENTSVPSTSHNQSSSIDRIVIFYTNGSFSEYKN